MRIILALSLLIAIVDKSKGNFFLGLSPDVNNESDSTTIGTLGHGLQDRRSPASSENNGTEFKALDFFGLYNGSLLASADVENTLKYLNGHVKSIQETEQGLQEDQGRLESEVSFLSSVLHGVVTKLQGQGTPAIPTFPGTGADPFHPGISDCGGITVSDKGFIVHQSGLNHTQRIVCTWTIRANTAEKIALRLVSDNLDPDISKLVVIPLKHMLRPNLTYQTAKWFQHTLVPGDRNEYLLEGSCAFVTLITNDTTTTDLLSQPSFALYFEGRGNASTFSTTTFTHYHYQSYSGDTTYPNGPSYKNNEVATFVLNPPVAKGNLRVRLPYVDIQVCGPCTCDFVKRWDFKKTRNYFMYWGNAQTDYRNCGRDTTHLLGSVAGEKESESWIVVFSSDGSEVGKGFRLSWSSGD